jgi:hypothetical protein
MNSYEKTLYTEVLISLRGTGKMRYPTRAFWKLRRRLGGVLHAAGLRVYEERVSSRHSKIYYLVDIRKFTRSSLARTLTWRVRDRSRPHTVTAQGLLQPAAPTPEEPTKPLAPLTRRDVDGI